LFPLQLLKGAVQEYVRGRPEIVAAFAEQRQLQNTEQLNLELHGQVCDLRSQLERKDAQIQALHSKLQKLQAQLGMHAEVVNAHAIDKQAWQAQLGALAELANARAIDNRLLTYVRRSLSSKVALLTSKVDSVASCLQIAVSPRAVWVATKIQALFRGRRCRRGLQAASAKRIQPRNAQRQACYSKKRPSKSFGKQGGVQAESSKAEWDLLAKSRRSKHGRSMHRQTDTYQCCSGIRLEDH